MAPHYAVAKYIRNPLRQEPVNVGVLLWANGQVLTRFLGESDAGFRVGGLSRLFNDWKVYEQWVDYWRTSISRPSVYDPATKKEVDPRNPAFVEYLVRSSRENFVVWDGGEVWDVGSDSPRDVLNYLYALLVSPGGYEEALRVQEVASTEEGEPEQRLVEEVALELSKLQLLETENADLLQP